MQTFLAEKICTLKISIPDSCFLIQKRSHVKLRTEAEGGGQSSQKGGWRPEGCLPSPPLPISLPSPSPPRSLLHSHPAPLHTDSREVSSVFTPICLQHSEHTHSQLGLRRKVLLDLYSLVHVVKHVSFHVVKDSN